MTKGLRIGSTVIAAIFMFACGRQEPTATPRTAPKPAIKAPLDQAPKSVESGGTAEPMVPPIARDLPAIAEEKTLRVLFTFNSTGYFLYRGETMGYDYELLQRFAQARKLRLKIVVVRDSRALIQTLNRGDGDIVAAQLVRPTRDPDVLFTQGLYETSPVVVQRKGEERDKDVPSTVDNALEREQRETTPEQIEIRARLVSTPGELAGRRVHMARNSPYRRRLMELNHELSDDVEVVEVDESTDRLIQELSEGVIGYTVAAENVASLKAAEYTNLIVRPALGPPEHVVWAVRRNSPELVKSLDEWLAAARKSGLLRVLYQKYFLDRRGFRKRTSSEFLTSETGRLSPWDDIFKRYAKIPGWDWRLLASQAYQESRFNVSAKSWAGATGLMQIMPATARELRINPSDPRQSVEGASRYLFKLDKYWMKRIPSEKERIKFILGSYNVGMGHVEDACRLATKNGDDPGSWDDVSYWLIRKSKRDVYNDPVVKYGFARGTEPVSYVDFILERYDNYKEFVKEDLAPEPEAAPVGTSSTTTGL